MPGGFTEAIAVIALVGDEHVGVRQGRQHGRGTAIVADLAFGEQQDQRFAVGVANRVQLGAQAALCPPDTTGNTPFLNKLAAVRWAFRCVASMTAPVASLMATSVGEDPVEEARLAPADEAVVERLRRAVDGRSIPPSHAIPDDMDYPADDAPVIDTRPATYVRLGLR